MKYYIATKLENWEQHNALRDQLDALGHECTYDWTIHGPVYKAGANRIAQVAELEMKGVWDASFVFVIWPGGRGTHIEMGAAIAAGCNVVFISDVEEHHIASPEICAFYMHPSVVSVRTIDEALDHLKKPYLWIGRAE